MLCKRCGAEIAPTQRYCMKCGAINYEHPENASMKQYITKEEIEKSNEAYALENDTSMEVQIDGRIFRSKKSHAINYIDSRATLTPIILVTILIGLLCYFWLHFSVIVSLVIGLIYFICTFYTMATACIYMKGGYSGLVPLVPFYAQYAFFDISFGKGWYFLFTLIPIVGIFFALYANYKLGKTFGKSGFITLFLPFIMYPIIAFSDISYQGEGSKSVKFNASGKRRNVIVPAIIYCVMIFFALFLPIKLFLEPYVQELSYISNAKVLLHSVEKDIKEGNYLCGGIGPSTEPGIYYIPFQDASSLSTLGKMKSSYNGNSMSGYIAIVVEESLNIKLYITLTDGIRGLNSVSESEKKKWKVVPLTEVSVPQDAIICKKS